MAAQPLVNYSYANPVETYKTNIMGTINLLETIRNCLKTKVIINITTDKCYENKEWFWGYREDEAMGGVDPYSSSKASSEIISSAYRRSYFNNMGIALATVRAGNVIGGGDWTTGRLVPDIISAFSKNEPVIIRNPTFVRPWQHVLEPLSGYLMLAEKLWEEPIVFSEAWNFGPNDNDAKPVSWIVEKLVEKWGNNAKWAQDKGFNHHEAGYLKLDISKAKQKLNWFPKWHLDCALDKVIDWHRAWEAGESMQLICLKQIDEYTFS